MFPGKYFGVNNKYDASINRGCIGLAQARLGLFESEKAAPFPNQVAVKGFIRFKDAHNYQQVKSASEPGKAYRIVAVIKEELPPSFSLKEYYFTKTITDPQIWNKMPYDFATLHKPAGKPAFWESMSESYGDAEREYAAGNRDSPYPTVYHTPFEAIFSADYWVGMPYAAFLVVPGEGAYLPPDETSSIIPNKYFTENIRR